MSFRQIVEREIASLRSPRVQACLTISAGSAINILRLPGYELIAPCVAVIGIVWLWRQHRARKRAATADYEMRLAERERRRNSPDNRNRPSEGVDYIIVAACKK